MKYYITYILLFVSLTVFSQTKVEIKWNNNNIISIGSSKVTVFNFDGANYNDYNTFLPYYTKRISIKENYSDINFILINEKYQEVDNIDLKEIKNINQLKNHIEINSTKGFERKKPFLYVDFIPIRKNSSTNKIEKLVSFEYKIEKKGEIYPYKSSNKYISNSVLKSGDWYKIRISEDGIYKLTYSELINMGINNPANIKVYGNGGSLLSINNSDFREDDLVNNSIWFEKGSDGIFNNGDYILFYCKGTTKWKYDNNNEIFSHTDHLFSDYSYYYLTSDIGTQKTIESINSNSNTETNNVTSFNHYQVHESNDINILKSGQLWLESPSYNVELSKDYSFSCPNIVPSEPVTITTSLLARSASTSNFDIKANGSNIGFVSLGSVSIGSSNALYATNKVSNSFFNSSSNNINLNIKYNKTSTTGEGWLDYIIVNTRRSLTMSGDQMHFRDVNSKGVGNIAKFNITASTGIKVWDITDIHNIKQINLTPIQNGVSFKAEADDIKEYITFKQSNFKSPTIIGKVDNQNLHGFNHPDMIIVSHTNFLSQANELAEIHRNEGLTVNVVTPEQVYNEFSSGTPDVSAIRDFMKFLYDNAATDDELPRYLLLFGDGSFDNKSNAAENTNYILTYQSVNSLKVTASYVTDDFFGLLDDDEGGSNGFLDIGIGRFPVKNSSEANAILNKIKNYISNTETFGDWRNTICFIGDDEDNNTHMIDANKLANKVQNLYPNFNIDKIFLDAYVQQSTPHGQRYPDVNRDFNDRVRKGALIINYTGHGNELGLAHEAILGINDIVAWENINKLPLFITATCEFSRFDDYHRTSGGETIFLNSKGGGIGLFTTTRLVYASPNFELNKLFYTHVFDNNEYGEMNRLGDVIRKTKVDQGVDNNKRNFTLLGDPALHLSLPKLNVIISSINEVNVSEIPDTLKALSKVTIKGFVANKDSFKISSYNGILYPTIFDKATTVNTLNNDNEGSISFELQKNILYKGKATVKNGEFSFTFIVPKDISYSLAEDKYGKISCYVSNSETDGAGNYQNIKISGTADGAIDDKDGPEINLFMNDEKFVFGGITDENPLLLANVSDDSGINTVGNGIGHDITAILDENTNKTLVLNEYYEADIDSYQSGKVQYNLSELATGSHKLKLKVWDVNNNSSEEYIEFIVAESSELVLEHIFNYPNPFTTNTAFYFDHNQPNTSLDVLIQVYTVTGKLVKSIDTQVYSDGFRSQPITWNGLDDYGDQIGRGVYIYRLKVRTPNGKVVDKFEKLVILK